MKEKTLHLTRAALIAALYVILTFLAQIFGLASGAIQFRLSEALTCMPLFYKEAIPGLWIGCILANLLTGCAMWDIVFGSVATLLGALGTYYIGRKKPALGPVFPIASNMLIVPAVLQQVYGLSLIHISSPGTSNITILRNQEDIHQNQDDTARQ